MNGKLFNQIAFVMLLIAMGYNANKGNNWTAFACFMILILIPVIKMSESKE